MANEKRVHKFRASSASARSSARDPKTATLIFMLPGNGDFVSVELASHVLRRLIQSATRVLRRSTQRARVRSTDARSATGQNR
jgi:hypothetical protein